MVASSGCLGWPARCLPLVALLAEMLLPFPPARPSQGFSPPMQGGREPLPQPAGNRAGEKSFGVCLGLCSICATGWR